MHHRATSITKRAASCFFKVKLQKSTASSSAGARGRSLWQQLPPFLLYSSIMSSYNLFLTGAWALESSRQQASTNITFPTNVALLQFYYPLKFFQLEYTTILKYCVKSQSNFEKKNSSMQFITECKCTEYIFWLCANTARFFSFLFSCFSGSSLGWAHYRTGNKTGQQPQNKSACTGQSDG